MEETCDASLSEEKHRSHEDVVDATPFNENLFMDEDLDGLDDELKELDIDDRNKSESN